MYTHRDGASLEAALVAMVVGVVVWDCRVSFLQGSRFIFMVADRFIPLL